ncbi:hypothetical protein [Streptococcus phocae]|uniref:Uncharacterized protein n=1 Tax=Streptococcus phocae TaxID=119224 RepID=A0A0P6SEP7_9STRE|nr:hypothetical protein [Streptococcus phocae]KPJ22711.1 hypothetical protein AKK44_03430 [Streptococcus phocae]
MKKKLLTFSLLSLLAIGLGTTTNANANTFDKNQVARDYFAGKITIEQIKQKYPSFPMETFAIGDQNGRSGLSRNITRKNLERTKEYVLNSPLGRSLFSGR